MSKTTITDTRIRLRSSQSLLKLLDQHKDLITEIPENINKALKRNGYSLPAKVEILKTESSANAFKAPRIDTKLLADLCTNGTAAGKDENAAEPMAKADKIKTTSKRNLRDKNDDDEAELNTSSSEVYLHLSDLRWLNEFLAQLRKEHGLDIFLHNLIEKCQLELPRNEVISRNPELEARCQKLREEQQNREYRKMTKNVDAGLKNYPEDTIAFQMKSINSQLVAVLQFVVSVIAGFVFGFLGIELIIGNLDFGLRLLLGVMFALIIALAEIYFLAKKLNEFDNAVDSSNQPDASPTKTRKAHID